MKIFCPRCDHIFYFRDDTETLGNIYGYTEVTVTKKEKRIE